MCVWRDRGFWKHETSCEALSTAPTLVTPTPERAVEPTVKTQNPRGNQKGDSYS